MASNSGTPDKPQPSDHPSAPSSETPPDGPSPTKTPPSGADQATAPDRPRKRSSGRGGHRLRTAGSAVTLVLASLIALVSVVAVWADDQIENTDRYVATVAPLAENPAVQQAVTDRVTSAIMGRIDMATLTSSLADTLSNNGLAPGVADTLRKLSGPLAGGVEGFVRNEVQNLVRSDAFVDLWTNANRDAHAAMVKALTGRGDAALNVDSGTVTLQLGPIVAAAQQRLVDRGFGLAQNIPEVDKSIVLVQSDQLGKVRAGVRILHVLGWWLPITALALAALGVGIAPNRRRALIGLGLGVLAAMLLLGLGLLIGRRIYLDRLPSSLSQDAARAIFDALVKFLRESSRTLAVLGAVTALAAFMCGSARIAATVRQTLRGWLGAVGRAAADAGARTGAFGTWVGANRGPVYAGVTVLGGLWLLLWNRPTTSSVLLVAVLVALVLALLEAAAATADAAAATGPVAAVPGDGATTWQAEGTKSGTRSGPKP